VRAEAKHTAADEDQEPESNQQQEPEGTLQKEVSRYSSQQLSAAKKKKDKQLQKFANQDEEKTYEIVNKRDEFEDKLNKQIEVVDHVMMLQKKHQSDALKQHARRISAVFRYSKAAVDDFELVKAYMMELTSKLEDEFSAKADDSSDPLTEAKKSELDEDIEKLKTKIDEVAAATADLKADMKIQKHIERDDDDPLDWDVDMKRYVKSEILTSADCNELLMKIELLVEDSWLQNGKDALPGNVYIIMAFEDLFNTGSRGLDWEAVFTFQFMKGLAQYFGCLLVCLIQILGPPLVFMSKVTSVGIIKGEKQYQWQYWRLSPSYDPALVVPVYFDWLHVAPTKFLALCFLMLFCLNGFYFLKDFAKTWKEVYAINRWLDVKTKDFVLTGQKWLWLGGFVNCWVVLWCCSAMYLVTGGSRCPQDVILDSLGLVFLFNLDDISGALGFVDEDDWPDKELGWVHAQFVPKKNTKDEDDDYFDRDDYSDDWMGWIILCLFEVSLKLTAAMTVLLPLMAAVTPFLLIAPSD
jgi:hypothetical protein